MATWTPRQAVPVHDDAEIWVVAGCLFEISLPLDGSGLPWRWANVGPEVTHLATNRRQAAQHLRFRAEASGAATGEVQLFFQSEGGEKRSVTVQIAPEKEGDQG